AVAGDDAIIEIHVHQRTDLIVRPALEQDEAAATGAEGIQVGTLVVHGGEARAGELPRQGPGRILIEIKINIVEVWVLEYAQPPEFPAAAPRVRTVHQRYPAQ